MMKNNIEFNYLTRAIELHEKFVQPYKGEPPRCLETEIYKLENQIGFELPFAYKEFLKFMGRDYNGIFQGSDCFINNVIENTKWLPELLAENKIDFVLPQNYLAFFSHQGYVMAWFELPKINENPPVWFFHESEVQETPKIIGTFSEWFLAYVTHFIPQIN